jgi:quercetin dioxygenase-like cupin family protein
MPNARIVATGLTIAIAAASTAGLVAQSVPGGAQWETLARAPIPEGIELILNINSLALPAEAVPRVTQPHTHAGPVVAYIVNGEIENQIEPEAPLRHKSGGFFVEPPMHVHAMLRNVSTTEPATLIICQVGRTRVPEPLLKPLLEETAARLLESQHQWQAAPLRPTTNQELRVFRLTLPPGASADSHAHTGPGFVYVLEGTVRASAASIPMQTHVAGDLFLDPPYRAGRAFANASRSEPATLLIYQMSDRSEK